LAYVVLGLGGLGFLVMALLAILAFTKRRVPLSLWIMLPVLAAGAGAVGSILGALEIQSSLATAPDPSVVVYQGLTDALITDWLGKWTAAVLLVCSTWLAAIPVVATVGKWNRWTIGSAFFAFTFTLLSVIGLVVYVVLKIEIPAATEAFAVIALIAFGGIGVMVGSTRRALEENATRIAAMRFATGMTFFIGVNYATKAMAVSQKSLLFELAAAGDVTAATNALAAAEALGTFAWIATIAGLLIGMVGFFTEFGDVASRGLLLDLLFVGMFLGTLGGVRFGEVYLINEVEAVGQRGPLSKLILDKPERLPTATVEIEGEVTDVPLSGTAVRDILVRDGDKWARAYKWTGTAWEYENSPLDSVALTPGPTLLVALGTDRAFTLADAIPAIEGAGGTAMLLIAPTKPDFTLPPQLSHLQARFFPLSLLPDPAFATGMWLDADSGNAFIGASEQFGPERGERDIAVRVRALVKRLAADQADIPVVLSPKSPVRDVVGMCVPIMFEADGVTSTGKNCKLYVSDINDLGSFVRTQADPPDHDMIATWANVDGPLDQGEAREFVAWEKSAFANCAAEARSDGETIKKRAQLRIEFEVDKEGQAGDASVHKRSDLKDDAAFKRCVMKRVKSRVFPIPDGAEAPCRTSTAPVTIAPDPSVRAWIRAATGSETVIIAATDA
jgi:hypothetical protein